LLHSIIIGVYYLQCNSVTYTTAPPPHYYQNYHGSNTTTMTTPLLSGCSVASDFRHKKI